MPDDLVQKMRVELESAYIGFRNWNGLERDIKGVADRWNQGLRGKLQLGTDLGMGVGAVGLGLAAGALKEAVGVESASGRVRAAYNVNQKDFDTYSKFIENNSVKLLQSQKDLWDGMGQIVAAGFSGKVADQIETGASKIATIFEVSLTDAIKPATIAMNDWHMSASKVYDLLGKASSMTPGGWAALMSGPVEKVFGLASQSGIGLDSLLSADVTLARKTGGGRAMGIVGQLVSRIGQLPGGAADLENHGLQGTIQHLLSVYGGNEKDLTKVFGGASNINYAEIIAGGKGNLPNPKGYIDTAFGRISKEVPEEWKGLKLEMEATAVSIGKVLIPDLQQFTAWIQPIAKSISDWTSHNADFAGTLIKAALGVGAFSLAIRAAMFVVNPLRDAFDLFSGRARAARQAQQDLSAAVSDMAQNKLPAMKNAEQSAAIAVQDMSSTKLPALQTKMISVGSTATTLGSTQFAQLDGEMKTVGATAVRTAETDLVALDTGMKTVGTTAIATAGESELGGLSGAISKLGLVAMTAAPWILGAIAALANAGTVANQNSNTDYPAGTDISKIPRHGVVWPDGHGGYVVANADGQNIPVVKKGGHWVVAPGGSGSYAKPPSYSNSSDIISLGAGAPKSIINSYPQVAQYWPQIVAAAKANGIDPYVLASLMATESSGNINAAATWNAGESAWDYGLFQYGPPEAAKVGGKYGPNVSAGDQIKTAAAYLAYAGLNAWNGSAEAGQVMNRAYGWKGSAPGYASGTGAIPPIPAAGGGGGGYQSSLPPDPAGVDHTGQPGWVMGADGKWHSVPKPTKSNYTWDFSTGSWVPTAAYREEQRIGGLYAGEKARSDAIGRVWSGVNPLDLPAHGNHGLNQTQWLQDQYKKNELLREQWDQSAKILYLQGKITYQQWQQVKAKDAMYVQSHDALAYQRLHPGSGGAASHIVPVKISGRCKEEADANVHRKAQADHAKGTKDAVAKSGDAIVNAVKGVHHAISALEKSLHHHGLHEGSHVPVGGGGSIEPAHAY